MENPDLFTEIADPLRRAALIDAKIGAFYEKRLKNLNLLERRIRRQHDRDIATLQALQTERLSRPIVEAQEAAEENIRQITRASAIATRCAGENRLFNPADFGFDFSNCEWNHFVDRQKVYYRLTEEFLDLSKVIREHREAA